MAKTKDKKRRKRNQGSKAGKRAKKRVWTEPKWERRPWCGRTEIKSGGTARRKVNPARGGDRAPEEGRTELRGEGQTRDTRSERRERQPDRPGRYPRPLAPDCALTVGGPVWGAAGPGRTERGVEVRLITLAFQASGTAQPSRRSRNLLSPPRARYLWLAEVHLLPALGCGKLDSGCG